MVKIISENEWKTEYQNKPGLVLVDVFAEWCKPCKDLGPKLEAMATDYQTVCFTKINADYAQEFCSRFSIKGLPTVMLFKDGTRVAEVVGFKPDEIVDMIKKNI